MRDTQLISVVIPCFNEELLLGELVARLSRVEQVSLQYDFEFVIVNDGSTDRSEVILNQHAVANPSLRVIHLGRNFGHQIAIAVGMDYASGDVAVIMDGDLQDPPELIPEIARKVLEEGYDVVHMQRRQRSGETWFKLACAHAFYWLYKKLINSTFVRNCGDFRGTSRRALTVIRSFREPHKFHRAAFAHVGLRQYVMPYDRDPRFAGETKYPLMSLIRLASNGVMSFSAAPLKVVLSLSMLLWLVGAAIGAKAVYGKVVLGYGIPGWTTTVVLDVFLTGLILLSLSIIGEYIRRIFEQGKGRPLYWIRETRNLDLNDFRSFSEHRLSQLVGESVLFEEFGKPAEQRIPSRKIIDTELQTSATGSPHVPR